MYRPLSKSAMLVGMEKVRNHPETSWTWLMIITLLSGVIAWYVVYTGREITLRYDSADQMANATAIVQSKKVELPQSDKPLVIPSYKIFADGEAWMYVSTSRPVAGSYTPTDLVEVDLPHGDSSEAIKLQATTANQLKKLFARSSAEGAELMVSSAYRSVSDQTKLYQSFVQKQGQSAANHYVAKPGMSEHHTGMAVDVTDASSACASDSDRCNLSPATASWLADIAPDFGFVIRYPSGKQPITGTAYEPWHLRYVGVTLAKQLSNSNLTLDEFIEQVAPGRLVSGQNSTN